MSKSMPVLDRVHKFRWIPPRLVPRNISQSLKLIPNPPHLYEVLIIVQLAIQLNFNECPYFACYIILPVLHYVCFIQRLFAVCNSGGEHLVSFAMCTDVSTDVRK